MAVGMLRAHLFVSGRVQGVGFRESVRRRAASRGVTGWVRNTPDGRVEALFEGEDTDVRELEEWCRHGPSLANVNRVDTDWQEPTGEFRAFEIVRGRLS